VLCCFYHCLSFVFRVVLFLPAFVFLSFCSLLKCLSFNLPLLITTVLFSNLSNFELIQGNYLTEFHMT
jgi:hypothetical protein